MVDFIADLHANASSLTRGCKNQNYAIDIFNEYSLAFRALRDNPTTNNERCKNERCHYFPVNPISSIQSFIVRHLQVEGKIPRILE